MGKELMDIRIRKVSVLEGKAKELAKYYKLEDNDLVILKVSIEKVEGSPIDYLMKKYLLKKDTDEEIEYLYENKVI